MSKMPKTKPQITAQQVQRVETVGKPDGHSYRRIFVKLTPEQKDYFRRARDEEEAAGPPKILPTRPRLEMVVAPEETKLLDAVDEYAAKHDLPNRGAVLRVALSKLLKLPLAIPHHGWKPGRTRKSTKQR
jgi:hypothetical protein